MRLLGRAVITAVGALFLLSMSIIGLFLLFVSVASALQWSLGCSFDEAAACVKGLVVLAAIFAVTVVFAYELLE